MASYDVIVVGCGAAGIAALRKLYDSGVKAVGLEAAGRIGGRINTVKFGDSTVDLGASWCVGDKGNPIFKLVKDLNLLDVSNHNNNWYLSTNGELANADKCNAILAALGDDVAKSDKNTTISIAEFVRSRANTNEILKKDPNLSKSLIEYFERISRIGSHGNLRDSESLKAVEEYRSCKGPWYNWKGRGFTTILDVLLNKYPDPSKQLPIDIQLNKDVQSIDWSSDKRVQVKCKDGSIYTAKSVIVTVSIVVLKERHTQLFNPPLPPNKVSIINDLQLCLLGKIYVEFTSPWWPQNPISIKILWTDKTKAKFSGDDKWLTEVFGLDTVAAQKNSLLVWVNSGGVKEMERRSQDDVEAGLNKLFDLVVKKQFNVTPIKAILRTQWTLDPLTGCLYAIRSVATEENQSGGAIELSEPLCIGEVPLVCFAGEATSHHWHHDAHGAVESGFREARRLIDIFNKKSIMDVIVIGCGAAGVAAIRKLHDAGLKVMGLEAAERIGGRIQTVDFGTGAVDIGAAWCHGEKDNIVFELANPLDLLGRPDPNTNFYVLSNGDLVPESTSQDILKAISDHVANGDKKGTQSILECAESAINTSPVLKSNPELTNSFIENYERMNHLGGQNDPKHGKSLRGLGEHWPCDGEFMLNWKGKGYKMILDVLLNKYPDPSKEIPVEILLNKEVESIRWGTNNLVLASLLPKANNPLVQVKCKDGSMYAAKSVIVTVSIGVLKERHMKLFNPPLPANKVSTINTLQLAVLDKIYIEFDKPWWPKTPASFVILWTDEDKAKFGDDKWITEIFALDTVAHQPNLLLAWLYGNGAEMMEKVSLAEVHAGVTKLMNKVLKKKFDVSPVKSVVRSQWASNPLARGAYAYRSVATELNDGDGAILLSEPLYFGSKFPIVCFAGEATSHHRHSAVHGAVESGFREAERLIESFKL